MYIFLTVLILIASVLLIGIVLIQKSKGGGLASNFQGANQIMGVKSANSFVEKATWWLAIAICVMSILTAFVKDADMVQSSSKVNAPQKQETTTPFETSQEKPAAAAPATNAPAANAPASETPAVPTPAK